MSANTTSSLRCCCPICAIPLKDGKARQIHKAAMHPRCDACLQRFGDLELLQSHQKETSHFFCRECDLHFLNWAGHINHVRAVQHSIQYQCCDCGREYTGQQSLDHHCCECDRVFRSSKGLNSHFASHNAHIPRASVPRVTVPRAQPDDASYPYKCKQCDRRFVNTRALRGHMSKKHKPSRHIPCLVGPTCARKFATPSALLSHLESGSCNAGMTRAKLNELVFAHDQNRYITDTGAAAEVTGALVQESLSQLSHSMYDTNSNDTGQHNLPEHEPAALPPISDDAASEWSVLDGMSDNGEDASDWSLVSGIHTSASIPMSYIDSDNSLPGTAPPHNLRCPLCHPNQKPLLNSAAFQAHITSAAHAPKIFRCPLVFVVNISPRDSRMKQKYFSTLSGLAQHLEGGSCRGGVATYKNAIMYLEEQLREFGFDGVRLLLD